MTATHTGTERPQKPLRIWPGVALVAVQWLLWQVVPLLGVDSPYPMFVALACGPLVLVWWLFFSRAPWLERIGVILLMVAGIAITYRLVDESIANGAMGALLPVLSIPVLSLALVAAAAVSRALSLSTAGRRAAIAGAVAVGCGVFTLLRTGGVSGGGDHDLHWRWTPTYEERLLATAQDIPLPAPAPASPTPAVAAPAAPTRSAQPDAVADGTSAAVPSPRAQAPAATAAPAASWPGFRGPSRDSVVRGVRIETDWTRKPPEELWRRPIGPGWSSFAVQGDLVYTQEQRGEDEIVACYRLSTGEPVWGHRDPARFWESNAGAGPRATPMVANGRVYTLGATGLVNALDAGTGAVIWSRNAAADTGKRMPAWGYAGSPLAVGGLVVVAVSSQLIAYDARTGEPRWKGPDEGEGYSSPHVLTIDGKEQIVLLRGRLATSVDPADGTVLWEHSWQPGVSILQPAVTPDHDVLLTTGDMMGGVGMRRISVEHATGGWTVEERWSSRALKPYFSDFVVHEGYAYGFDGNILACVDLETGQRRWKGGRYGSGQMLLLADQDLLLVLSEDGELALVAAVPGGFTELAKVPAIEGKTWNHPVVAGDIVLVRNGQEMAAFRLPGVKR
jgi:outer membrane protein assembly factor BamB